MTFDFTLETTNHFKEIKFQWKIKNFSKFTNEVEGPPFFPFPGHFIRWQSYIKFESNAVNYSLMVFLRSLDDKKVVPPLIVDGKIYLKNSKGKEWRNYTFNRTIKPGGSIECCKLITMDHPLPSSINKLFLCEDDVFVVEWSVTVSGIVTSIVTPALGFTRVKKEDGDITKALKSIYKKNAFTDVTFQIGKQSISAHKAVLSARSAVFEKMFEHDTLEKETSTIDIKDCDYRTFDCFVGYVYTKEIRSEVKDDLHSLLALYDVADKYEVCDLQRCCADMLLSCFLNVDSVVTIVEVADMHNDQYLKAPAMQFIRHKFSEVAMTPGWSNLRKHNIELGKSIVSFATTFVEEKK